MFKRTLVGVALSLVVPAVVLASQLTIPNLFAANEPIDPAKLNANFAAVAGAVNTRVDLYGDGSAGALTITSGTDWNQAAALPANLNFQFTDFTVPAGVTFTVPSGTVIRTTGSFRNDGTIIVSTGAAGGAYSGTTALAPPVAGISLGVPCLGLQTSSIGTVTGGCGGRGISLAAAADLLRPGTLGGGGGAAGRVSSTVSGGAGGGTLVVISMGKLTNGGTIEARGGSAIDSGLGGGGGGIVVLAGRSASNLGTISVRGGNGGPVASTIGGGGGGGGGIVHLVGRSVSNTGSIDVLGGLGGTGTGTLAFPRMAGSGGGGCGGSGGQGGSLSGPSPLPGANGANGYTLVRPLEPTTVF